MDWSFRLKHTHTQKHKYDKKKKKLYKHRSKKLNKLSAHEIGRQLYQKHQNEILQIQCD